MSIFEPLLEPDYNNRPIQILGVSRYSVLDRFALIFQHLTLVTQKWGHLRLQVI